MFPFYAGASRLPSRALASGPKSLWWLLMVSKSSENVCVENSFGNKTRIRKCESISFHGISGHYGCTYKGSP